MSDFKVVADDLRFIPAHKIPAAAFEALVEGKTIWVPFNGRKEQTVQNIYRQAGQRRGFVPHGSKRSENGENGLLVWWDKR